MSMRFVFYTHSLVSDWNHGNAHFLRGVMRELLVRGHQAVALEPADGWSRRNLLADQGAGALVRFERDFPELTSVAYEADFDHEAAISDADAVIVHEWTDPELVARIGRARRLGGKFTLLFHDTHHRAVSSHSEIASLALEDYDGVLAFGESLRARYLELGWPRDRVFTWHEAADIGLFAHRGPAAPVKDLIWIGNWGDEERSKDIADYLVEPACTLNVRGTVRGVRYPDDALRTLAKAGFTYGGWIANADVPDAFAAHKLTVHVPRKPYVEQLPGIPTIRIFEALACGIPLLSAPWPDCEGLFRAGTDFLMARNPAEMLTMMREVLADARLALALARSGRETIERRHSCRHRVDELLAILAKHGTDRARHNLLPKEAAA
jgi:spore maturation protein CgeB